VRGWILRVLSGYDFKGRVIDGGGGGGGLGYGIWRIDGMVWYN